ncbi:MAG TPA: hypothetical protein VKW08_11950 [Xanthobacteraceae bacterium]|jgi:hypothetical protein|nr:hypothetical protein [Xanthobacteraceae bacterium]
MTMTQPPDSLILAKTREGFDLPVIDLTNPRFAVPNDAAAVRELYQEFVDGERRRRHIPKFIMRMMLRSAARQSRLVDALFSSETGYLDAISTYVMKLGPDNLVPPYDTPMDHRFAASSHVPLVRLRMFQVARLVADALTEELPAAPASAPLSLINIGGGPALDSINALIFLRRDRPEVLDRPISILVLDASADGAFFGANALAALQAEGRPLAGLSIGMQHQAYDWDEPSLLERLLAEQVTKDAIIAATSEGALFEYGSDQAIIANLKVLGAGGARLVAGSVTGADQTRRRSIASTRLKLVPRGLEGFAPLAAQAGFRIAKSEAAMISDQVLLRPV